MSSYLALYSGETIGSSRLVCVTSNPDLVARFAEEMMEQEEIAGDEAADAVARGRRQALQVVKDEAEDRRAGE